MKVLVEIFGIIIVFTFMGLIFFVFLNVQRRARFSFMGGKGGTLWKQLTFKLSDRRFD